MESILYIAHTDSEGKLGKPAFEALTAAANLAAALGNAPLSVGLMGESVQAAADSIAGCGAAKFLGASGGDFAQARYATDAAAVEALCRAAQATIVVVPATSRLSRVVGGVALRLEGRVDTHVTGITVTDGTVEIKRWYYRQRMLSTIKREQRPWILAVDPGSHGAWTGAGGAATVETVNVSINDAMKRTAVTGTQAPGGDEQTIRPEAQVLFVAGAGWTKKQEDGQPHVKEAEALILDFLHGAKASLGGSKSMVDLSSEGEAVLPFMSHLNQVGQTGSTPRHPKGLATCCHGEEPHVVGWRFINERRAINTDATCGWAQGKADVLYVADAFKVMEKVNGLLGKG